MVQVHHHCNPQGNLEQIKKCLSNWIFCVEQNHHLCPFPTGNFYYLAIQTEKYSVIKKFTLKKKCVPFCLLLDISMAVRFAFSNISSTLNCFAVFFPVFNIIK